MSVLTARKFKSRKGKLKIIPTEFLFKENIHCILFFESTFVKEDALEK